ncbi:molybdopterin converting factor subunit 1 [Rheinheimera riviphila]|uniref:Molybdopterin synthase sulfur carrier subunit n=1 Tax=Rheinheimera riviphila TaxID=1834037 RepID=A0A437QBI0_9GAMM|nr:molybdopterin converting factor subunit 1 [Rheinheimera riviphila]RVU31908.1 molybdopterin converting factor subunit 1 [Rheinheimera riviphila]
MIKILFFAALRERLQCRELQLAITQPCQMQDVLKQLQQQSEKWQQVFSEQQLLCALNQQICSLNTLVHPGDELAFFPPVTGG